MSELFEEPGAYDHLEGIIRNDVTDEQTRDTALHSLAVLRRERAALIMGCAATLNYVLVHDELPREGRQQPAVCPIPQEAMGELYLWQSRVLGGNQIM
jgi:hypothetical protein